jgi:hypothetical protein
MIEGKSSETETDGRISIYAHEKAVTNMRNTFDFKIKEKNDEIAKLEARIAELEGDKDDNV